MKITFGIEIVQNRVSGWDARISADGTEVLFLMNVPFDLLRDQIAQEISKGVTDLQMREDGFKPPARIIPQSIQYVRCESCPPCDAPTHLRDRHICRFCATDWIAIGDGANWRWIRNPK